MKYRFNRARTVEALLKAIGRTDISSADVSISIPTVDPETGERFADFEIDFGAHELSPMDEEKLKDFMKMLGYEFKEKVGESE